MVVTYIYGYLQYMVAAELEIWWLEGRFDGSSGRFDGSSGRYGGYSRDLMAPVEI